MCLLWCVAGCRALEVTGSGSSKRAVFQTGDELTGIRMGYLFTLERAQVYSQTGYLYNMLQPNLSLRAVIASDTSQLQYCTWA